jgi:hypothetical protein
MPGFQSFLTDMAAYMRRKKEDTGRVSLFEKVSPGNVGNVFNILPSNIVDSASPESFGQPVRVLEIAGEDALGEMICVSIQQESLINIGNSSNLIVEGPLVGIVEFGAGAGLSNFEFDIPAPVIFPGKVQQDANSKDLFISRKNNGVLLTLPASSMRVFVRNDGSAPYLIDLSTSPTSINRFYVIAAGPHTPNLNPQPAIVRVHATYGRRPFQSSLTRSYPICHSDNGGPTGGFTPGTVMFIGIPAYAKRVLFPRSPLTTTTLQVVTFQGQITGGGATTNASTGNFTIPAGSLGPVELSPLDTFIRITNPANAPNIMDMSVVFELGI